MRGIFLNLISLGFCALHLTEAQSQETSDRSEVFREGYVRELMKPSAEGEQAESPAVDSQTDTATIETTNTKVPSGTKLSIEKVTIARSRLTEEKAGVRVKSIGAILALSSRAGVERDVGTISALADRLSIGIGNVFFVLSGVPQPEFNRDLLDPLGQRGASIRVRFSPPREYRSVKKAPVWIISTEKGDVLLEGAEHPEEFFNSKGEFVEPES